MAIRSEVVRPDTVLAVIEGREIAVVSREAMVDAAIRAVDVMMLAGGEFTMSSQRVPTGFANESVSAVGFLTWRSGTARTSRPAPEDHVEPQIVLTGEQRREADAFAEAAGMNLDDEADDEPERDEADVEDLTAAR